MKAIIPAAGLGTRFLPATKCTPKEMLPVLDKPVIQYVVEEALAPEGVDEVVIVNSHDKPQIEAYFSHDVAFEEMLRGRGKGAYADAVSAAADLPVSYAYQEEALGLGHAVRCAADKMDGDPFFVLLGDYVVPAKEICKKMLEVSRMHGGASVIAVAPVRPDEVDRYGIIAGEQVESLGEHVGPEEPGAIWKVTGMVEKPAPADAPSHLFIVGRYLLSPLVMELLADQEPGAGNEIQLTDAMERALAQEDMYAVVIDPAEGYDTGTVAGWIATNARMAQADARFSQAYAEAMGA